MSYGLVTKKTTPGIDEGLGPSPRLQEESMSNLAAMLTNQMAAVTWLEPEGAGNATYTTNAEIAGQG